jgi:hypothetical protein
MDDYKCKDCTYCKKPDKQVTECKEKHNKYKVINSYGHRCPYFVLRSEYAK